MDVGNRWQDLLDRFKVGQGDVPVLGEGSIAITFVHQALQE